MTRFDEMLRRGLMDANLAQYETVLQHANDMQPDFSPHYLRERTRMLADPWEWGRRRSVRRRIDWRLIAIAAALLLLSACAYAVATGQFSQWFPRLGVDLAAPEVSEDVLSRTGTVIEQSQTVGDATLTLHAAVWDGSCVYLSFDIEGIDVPEEVQQFTPLYPMDCRLILREDQKMEYERNGVVESYAGQGIEPTPEQLEADIQARLEVPWDSLSMWPEAVEEHKLFFQENPMLLARWFTETKQPELTLHLGSLATAIYGEDGNPTLGEVILEGPFDLTFTLGEPILPIHYDGANLDATAADYEGVERSVLITGFQLSVRSLTVFYEDVDPSEMIHPGEALTPERDQEIWTEITGRMEAATQSIQGLWTADGKYVDLTNGESSGGSGDVERKYPYPIDPATITAVDIAGTRVELSDLEVVPAE